MKPYSERKPQTAGSLMRAMLIACAVVVLLVIVAEAQTRGPITRQTAAVSAPNGGGALLCPGCLAWAAPDVQISEELPVTVTVDGQPAFVWLVWREGFYFEIPPTVAFGRRNMPHRSRVEISHNGRKFFGSAVIVASAFQFVGNTAGELSGYWHIEGQEALRLLSDGPVRLSAAATTILVLQGINLGATDRAKLYIGTRSFEAEGYAMDFPGFALLLVRIQPSMLEPGAHFVVAEAFGRYSRPMLALHFTQQQNGGTS